MIFDEEFVINQPVKVSNIVKLYHPDKLYETRVQMDGMLVGVGLLDGEMHLLIKEELKSEELACS